VEATIVAIRDSKKWQSLGLSSQNGRYWLGWAKLGLSAARQYSHPSIESSQRALTTFKAEPASSQPPYGWSGGLASFRRSTMRKFSYYALMFLLALVAFVVALNIHEIGHTIVAQLAGDHNARYFLYHHEPGKGTCIGCNIYDETRLSYLGNVAVTIGGVAITQVIVIALVAWGSSQKVRSIKRHIICLVSCVFAIDAPIQVLQALLANVGAQRSLTRVDLADTLYLLMQRSSAAPTTLKVALVFALAAYAAFLMLLYVRVNRLRRSWPDKSFTQTPLRGLR
jgi:hypothetical protein